MLDPFPIAPPAFLVSAIKPFADALNLHTLPLHAHEVLFAAALYTFTEKIFSPWFSTVFFPNTYPRMSRRGKLNWDVHIVSFVQAMLINALSLYVIWFDEERKAWRSNDLWDSRIWGYYGSGGLVQSFALGYFLWDLYTCSSHVDIFGWGMLAHAVSAVAVFGLGYRPYIYFSAPIFLLYELSSPFLNIHWFCDKLDLTGSIYQAINGAFLVGTFFACRIVWGLYSSAWVFRDMYWIIQSGRTDFSRTVPGGKIHVHTTQELLGLAKDSKAQLIAFNREHYVPLWIPVVYLLSNLCLNSLNIFWFGKMIETIRTRFDPPWGTKGVESDTTPYKTQNEEHDEKHAPQQRKRRQSIPQLNPEGGTVEEEVDDEHNHASNLPPEKKVEPASAESAKLANREISSPQESLQVNDGDSTGLKKKGSVRAARQKAEEALNGPVGVVQDTKIGRADPDSVDDDYGVEAVSGSARKSARSRRKA